MVQFILSCQKEAAVQELITSTSMVVCEMLQLVDNSELLTVHLPAMGLIQSMLEGMGISSKEKQETRHNFSEQLRYLAGEHRRQHGKKPWPKVRGTKQDRPFLAICDEIPISNSEDIHSWEDLCLLPPLYRRTCLDVYVALSELARREKVNPDKYQDAAYNGGLAFRTLLTQRPDLNPNGLADLVSVEYRAEIRAAYRTHHENISRRRAYEHSSEEVHIEENRNQYIGQKYASLQRLQNRNPGKGRRRISGISRTSRMWKKLEIQSDALEELENTSGPVTTSKPQVARKEATIARKEGSAPGEARDSHIKLQNRTAGLSGRNRAYIKHKLKYMQDDAMAYRSKGLDQIDLAGVHAAWFPCSVKGMDISHLLTVAEGMLCLHMGLLPEVLAEIKAGTWPDAETLLKKDNIYYDLDYQSFISLIPIEIDVGKLLERSSPLELPRGAVVCPLPGLIKGLLDKVITETKPSPGSRLFPRRIKRKPLLPAGVTLLKLTHAYADYYCGWYGLDPEAASLIAGRPVRGRGSGSHYYSTDYLALMESYQQVFDRFLQDILANCRAMRLKVFTPKVQGRDKDFPLGPVGSFIAPEPDDVRVWVASLRERLETATRSNVRRNLCAVYVYEALRIASGMRAQTSPPFRSASVYWNAGFWWIRISDKDAGGTERTRVVPLAARVAAMVKELHEHNVIRRKPLLGADLENAGLRWPDVLFMNTKGRNAYPLSYPNMRRTSERYGLIFPDWKANSFRHLVSSWIHEHCGFKETDYLLGHVHRGAGADDPLGDTSYKQHAVRILPAMEQLLDELDVRQIRIS